jgi:methyl-accepting chemotaxis protein
MSLETAAATALEKLKELMPQIEEGEQALERSALRIDEAMSELQEGWDALHAYAQRYDERYQSRSRDTVERHEAQAERIDGLAAEVAEVKEEIGDEYEETLDALRALTDEADEAREDLAAATDRAEERAQRFEERMHALDERLQRALDVLARFVEDEVEPALEHMGDAMEERAFQLRRAVEAFILHSETGAGQLVRSMEHLAMAADDMYVGMGKRAGDVSMEAVRRAVERLSAGADEIAQYWEVVDGALCDLDEALEQGAEQVGDAHERLAGLGGELGGLLNEVIEGASHALEFFSRFSFV